MTREEIVEVMATAIFDASDGWHEDFRKEATVALSALEAKGLVVVQRDEVTRGHQATEPQNSRATDSEPSVSPCSFPSGA